MAFVQTELKNAIGTITFSNPSKRNALSNDLLQELLVALAKMEQQKARVLILRAAPGSKAWSAGLDISQLPQPGRDPLSYYDPLERLLRTIERLPMPVIGMISKGVWGGACDLAVTCDILVGDESCTFAITPAKIGVPYNCTGLIHFINIVGMRVVKETFFTAQPISAQQALNLGVLNHLVPAGELEVFTYKLAENITQNSPLAISVIKEQLRMLGNSHPLSPETFERIQGLRRRVYDSTDYQEGQRAFLEKRGPEFKGE